jgi:hypothetical protein
VPDLGDCGHADGVVDPAIAPSTAQIRSGHPAAQATSRPAWTAAARTRTRAQNPLGLVDRHLCSRLGKQASPRFGRWLAGLASGA